MTSHARLIKSLCRIYLVVYFWLLSCRLVIASRFQPTAVLLALLNFLAPSRPFVVYSQHKEVSWLPRWLMAFYRGDQALVSSRCWTRLIALPCGLSRRRSVSESLSLLHHWFPHFVLVSFKSGKALRTADTEWGRGVRVCEYLSTRRFSSSLSFFISFLSSCSRSSSATWSWKSEEVQLASDWRTLGWDIIR